LATTQEIFIPDIGTTDEVDVIDVLINPGDSIAVDDALITLESDKASMDVPSPIAGKVTEVKVSVGDKVKQGALVALVEIVSDTNVEAEESTTVVEQVEQAPAAAASETTEQVITLPDIGTSEAVDVIEVFVKVGDEVAVDDALITLESDKASMDVPATLAGTIVKMLVKVGDKVKTGDPVVALTTAGAAPSTTSTPVETESSVTPASTPTTSSAATPVAVSSTDLPDNSSAHAGPAVRRLARELGVDLTKVTGTGRKARILLEDVHKYVKAALQKVQSGSGVGFGLPKPPVIDFSQFGDTAVQPLSKIKKISGANLQRNWMIIPHVTQFDEADITELEAFRQANKGMAEKQGYKLTPLAFIMKAVVATLQAFPTVNASLDETGENLILKQYYHIGVAVDTPNGLVVPVIRNVDQKSVSELAKELGEVSAKARDKKLSVADMQGASFTISSLGGISGTGFTPIVNLPEVAILGVSRSIMKPVYQNGEFIPRLMLPLSFSYDHRVIDGAEAARFTKHLSMMLSDLRRILL